MNTKHTTLLLLLALCAQPSLAQQAEHNEEQHPKTASEQHDEHSDEDHSEHQGHDDHEGEAEEGLVELSPESIRLAGIETRILEPTGLKRFISAPGEVALDQYASADISPLVDAVIIERHAQLGDSVVAGQTLVTLASIDVATAQGELTLAASEWRRVRKLGRTAVGARRFTVAEVAYQQARLKLRAYGLDQQQIEAAASPQRKRTLGQFTLNAPLAGTVLLDDFRPGQRVEAGHSLFLIADESRVWIEAHLSPLQAREIQVSAHARVNMGGHWHDGKVIQKHHLLDKKTRTVPLRIAVEPGGEHHHAGEFVQVEIAVTTNHQTPSLFVPESALMQNNEGQWTIFIEVKAGHFQQHVIKRGQAQGQQVPISGIPAGLSVVTNGAFFLAAELAKSGFDIHNH